MENQPTNNKHSLRPLLWMISIIVILAIFAGAFISNNRPPSIVIPSPKMPNPNGWDDFVRAIEMIKSIKLKGPYSDMRPIESWTVPQYEAFVSAYTPAMNVVKGGLEKPYLCPPQRGLYDMSISRSLSRIREVARVLAGEARYYQITKQPAQAADSLLDTIELGITIPKGGDVITNIVGNAIASIGIHPFDKVIDKLSSQDLDRIAGRLEMIKVKKTPYSDIILEEGRQGASQYMEIFRNPKAMKEISDPRNWLNDPWWVNEGKSKPQILLSNAKYALSNKTGMVNSYMKYCEYWAAEQRGVFTGKSSVPVPDNPMLNYCADMFLRGRRSDTKNDAFFVLLQTDIALRRHQMVHGFYPASLSDLTPTCLKSLPIDPFGLGKPLKYRQLKSGKDFLLYSVGLDMKDDNGTPASKKQGWKKGDLVEGKIWDQLN